MSSIAGPSPHLTWDELACHDAERTPFPEEWRDKPWFLDMVEEFEVFRDMGGSNPLPVSSAYRTLEHHLDIYKALGRLAPKMSAHLEGKGLDLMPLMISVPMLHDIGRRRAKQPGTKIRGLGFYAWGLHMDVMDRGYQAVAYWHDDRNFVLNV